MANSIARLAKSIKYFTKRFGVITGLKVFLKVALYKRLPGNDDKIISVNIPQSKAPVFMRPKTTDAYVFWQVFLAGDYDLPINFLPAVIVDAGAHIGYASLYMLHRFPDAKIIAVEPEPSNADLYAKNLALEKNVTLYKAALWRDNTPLNIENPNADSWSFRVEESKDDSDGVEAITVADILKETGHIDILKLDIEGAEKELFSGDSSWLDQVKMVILELHEKYAPGCTELVHNVLTKHGFKKSLDKGENVIYQKQ